MFVNRIAAISLVAVAVISPTCVHAQGSALRDTIDREIRASWTKEKITPPATASDSVFLRRIYLDLVGMIPTYDETTAFLKDTESKKREKLIDRLLADPRYSRQQSHAWDTAMLGLNQAKTAWVFLGNNTKT